MEQSVVFSRDLFRLPRLCRDDYERCKNAIMESWCDRDALLVLYTPARLFFDCTRIL